MMAFGMGSGSPSGMPGNGSYQAFGTTGDAYTWESVQWWVGEGWMGIQRFGARAAEKRKKGLGWGCSCQESLATMSIPLGDLPSHMWYTLRGVGGMAASRLVA